MKRIIFMIGISFLLLTIPVGASTCDCESLDQPVLNNRQTMKDVFSGYNIGALRLQGEIQGWTFTVGENPVTQYPLEELCGLVEPDEWWADAKFDPCEPTRDLPDRFDWRDLRPR